MATATFQVYQQFLQNILKADIDFDTVVFKAALAATAYSPNMDTHDFWDDVVANEITGTNWAAGGQTTAATVSVDAGTNEVRVAFADISVPTVTLTDGKHVIVYNSSPGTNATRHLVGYGTFDRVLAPTAGTLGTDLPA